MLVDITKYKTKIKKNNNVTLKLWKNDNFRKHRPFRKLSNDEEIWMGFGIFSLKTNLIDKLN